MSNRFTRWVSLLPFFSHTTFLHISSPPHATVNYCLYCFNFFVVLFQKFSISMQFVCLCVFVFPTVLVHHREKALVLDLFTECFCGSIDLIIKICLLQHIIIKKSCCFKYIYFKKEVFEKKLSHQQILFFLKQSCFFCIL